MTRAFTSQLAVMGAAAIVASAVEAALGSLRARAGAVSLDGLGLWAAPAVTAAALLAWLSALLIGEEPWQDALARQWALRRERMAARACGGALLASSVFMAARLCLSFRNVELAAALLTVLVLVATALCAGLALALERWAGRGRAMGSTRLLDALAFGAIATSVLLIGIGAWHGFVQLDPRLLGPPAAFLLALVLFERWRWLRAAPPLGVLVTSAGVLVGGCAFLGSARDAAVALAQSGAWSPHLLWALQRATDVDRDGFSSLLGGGDCAPFDAAVGPAAAEIHGDGLDNNCVGGDSGSAAAARRPHWGAAAHGAITNQNLVVVTVETLRADHTSLLGYARDTTPELDKLAAEALVFERMYSAAPHTRLALASLFSSYAPSEIAWLRQSADKRMRRIGPSTPWLPELLRARGYDTYAVLTDFAAFTAQEDAGFERGFGVYDVSTQLAYRGGTMWGFPAAEQTDKAIGYLKAAARPFMLWLHLFEPHYHYEQPPDAPRFGTDEQARYDAEIWHVDRQLGRLVQALKEHDVWDKTLLLVCGDHGESFGEHGARWHGSNLHDPQLRTAALLRVPGLAGKRIRDAVTLTDLAPTVTRLLGDRQSFDQLRGRSLTPLLHRGKLPPGLGSFVTESFSVDDGRAYQAALVAYPLKLLYVEGGGRMVLYDLERDPAEQTPLDPARDVRATPLRAELLGYLERARPARSRH